MTTFQWTKIEAGQLLARGSWLKGLLCDYCNKFIVFGHPDRSMQQDYRDRVQSFTHFACVDMEIFGIYKPPPSTFSGFAQGLGLALLKDPVLADLKITSTDQQHILVNSAVLSQRWPSVNRLLGPILSPRVEKIDLLDMEKRELLFPDTYVVLVAFLQFIYTDHLVTAQQHQPQILTRLLFISNLFDIPRLKALTTHALHQMLNIQTAAMIYESAALSDTVSLQIRALRVMINAKKMMQRQKILERQNQQQTILIHDNNSHQLLQVQQNSSAEASLNTVAPSSSLVNSSAILPTPSNSNRLIQELKLTSSTSSSRESTRSNTPNISQTQFQQSNHASYMLQQQLQQSGSAFDVMSNNPAGTATKNSGATIKLPNFRMRQLSAAQQVALQYSSRSHSEQHNYDLQHPFPLSSISPSPRVTPSNSTLYFPNSSPNHSYTMPSASSTTAAAQARSHVSSFWRQATTSISGASLKKPHH
ncbi:hypothetical protein BDF20DRAFT_851972 [Mycotypha africana]|uniref:uncharacterized protein n=1 Tax=Mycotypha africana TaxID=64632 RepID=UPI0023003913|nr:uncharacterized protein BDF20DRAFT_851972 [Mycotypha africana]KAI8987738.1 hypothetical protein BDF20DRAFT_851972 [Mycotypha africana]